MGEEEDLVVQGKEQGGFKVRTRENVACLFGMKIPKSVGVKRVERIGRRTCVEER